MASGLESPRLGGFVCVMCAPWLMRSSDPHLQNVRSNHLPNPIVIQRCKPSGRMTLLIFVFFVSNQLGVMLDALTLSISGKPFGFELKI